MGWVERKRWVFGCVACVPMRAFSFDDTLGALLLIAFVVADVCNSFSEMVFSASLWDDVVC